MKMKSSGIYLNILSSKYSSLLFFRKSKHFNYYHVNVLYFFGFNVNRYSIDIILRRYKSYRKLIQISIDFDDIFNYQVMKFY